MFYAKKAGGYVSSKRISLKSLNDYLSYLKDFYSCFRTCCVHLERVDSSSAYDLPSLWNYSAPLTTTNTVLLLSGVKVHYQ
jgi:hypothetical protein